MTLPDPSSEPVITVERAGAILGIGRATAYAAVKEGRIPSIRPSARRVVVPTAAFLEMLRVGVAPS